MIVRVALPVPLNNSYFDYLMPLGIDDAAIVRGVRVRVPFGRRQLVGVVVAIATSSDYEQHKLKAITAVIDEAPLIPEDLLRLCEWASDYYHHPLGEVIATALPARLRDGKLPHAVEYISVPERITESLAFTLTAAQQMAVDSVTESLHKFAVFLLHGVTGSGKTQVYLETVARVINQGQQALILVPEIGLTPQLVQRFESFFKQKVVALHSALTDKQRCAAWMLVHQGIAKIIIGTRSAVFVPLKNPGIIVIDEEHDVSFKQQEGFRYSARDLALIRAKHCAIPIVLGSATPSLETFYQVNKKRYHYLTLPTRAGSAVEPVYHLIDCRRHTPSTQAIALPVFEAMHHHLAQGNQVLVFLNRRGYAPVMMCHGCGFCAICPRCDVSYTYHQAEQLLRCHHCDKQLPIFSQCPECRQGILQAVGIGTERLESVLTEHFVDKSVVRIDRDTTRKKNSLPTLLQQVHDRQADILLGTQLLAKGHHFPHVTLVVILNVDNGLFSGDFRALERMGQLIVQVAGRAGRADKPGTVMLQTHHPDHPLLRQLLENSYADYAVSLLQEREQAGLPPYSFLAVIRADSVQQESPLLFLRDIQSMINGLNQAKLTVLGPVPSPMPRRAGKYRAQLMLQTQQRAILHDVLAFILKKADCSVYIRRVHWSIDVDPVDMF